MNKRDNYTYEEVLELTKQGVEIWRRVVVDGIVFDYEVSNLGRIKSLKENCGGGKKVGYGNLNKNIGYMQKVLYYTDKNGNKNRKKYFVHRLVAIIFVPNTDNKPFVDHIDTNRNNNKVDNLRWATQQENLDNSNTKKNMSKSQKGKTRINSTDKNKYPHITEEDILSEEWRTIDGYEEIYEVSNMGRVKSLGFKRHYNSRSKERLLKPSMNECGYQVITLTDKNGNKKTHRIHQIVAKHFIPNPENKSYVDHINANKVDNRYFNLRWVTHEENMNNDKTIENLSRPVIVLNRNGNVISNGLGVVETSKNIGISDEFLLKLLKSSKPYRASVKHGRNDNTDLLRLLNGARAYYIDTYNEKEILKEIAEDKTDYSYLKGDLVCIYPNGKISEPMNRKELAKELKISKDTVSKMRDSKSQYKVSDRYHASKEKLEYYKTLEGIRIMYYEDYLNDKND